MFHSVPDGSSVASFLSLQLRFVFSHSLASFPVSARYSEGMARVTTASSSVTLILCCLLMSFVARLFKLRHKTVRVSDVPPLFKSEELPSFGISICGTSRRERQQRHLPAARSTACSVKTRNGRIGASLKRFATG
jgi:hypothetical protein